LEGRQATLDDLFEPEVLHGVAEAVRKKQREIARECVTQPGGTDGGDCARKNECDNGEQNAVHAVVVAVVDGLMQTGHARL
jgi:hypothetical protein